MKYSELEKLCKALMIVANRYDIDATAQGKGRDLSNVPGYEGVDILEYAAKMLLEKKGGAK